MARKDLIAGGKERKVRHAKRFIKVQHFIFVVVVVVVVVVESLRVYKNINKTENHDKFCDKSIHTDIHMFIQTTVRIQWMKIMMMFLIIMMMLMMS